MRKIIILPFLFFYCGAVFAQSQVEISKDPENGSKVLKGIISKEQLINDSEFVAWYTENLKGYIPYKEAVLTISKNTKAIQFIAFMGTWCEDSHFVIPKFYRLLDAAGFPQNQVTLIGVDRNKTTTSHLAEALNITNVPTILVMKEGKEIGRVVEYGKYGAFDKELGEIIKAAETSTIPAASR